MALSHETKIGPQQEVALTRLMVTEQLGGTAAATAANYGVIYTADNDYELVDFAESHETAGSDGGAVTLMLKKCTGTQAPAAGTDMLAATANLKGTANTVQRPALSATLANRRITRGDRLALLTAGTLTAVAGVHVTCMLKRI